MKRNGRPTVIMTTLECMLRSEVFLAPPKYAFRKYTAISHGAIFKIVLA